MVFKKTKYDKILQCYDNFFHRLTNKITYNRDISKIEVPELIREFIMNEITKIAPVRVNPIIVHPDERRIKLDGEWHFSLDPDEQGLKERWFENENKIDKPIQVPGCWQAQGFGYQEKRELAERRGPAQTFRAMYAGTAWYAKTFSVPSEWNGSRVLLNFGGVSPSAEIWLNGIRLGENQLPFAPFGFEVSKLFKAGENTVVVRVHEEARALALVYNMQGEWSGLYRSVELTATGKHSIEEFRVYPELDRKRMRIRARIGGWEKSDKPLMLRITTQALAGGTALAVQIPVESEIVEYCLDVPNPLAWSPEDPQLYKIDGVLEDSGNILDALTERAGFVKLTTSGKHFLINDQPYFMRGHGDFPAYPETVSPDTDRKRWIRKLKVLRDYGYNHVRCNSFVHPPEYFDAADEVGLLVQSEMGTLRAYNGAHPTEDNREVPNYLGQNSPIVIRDIKEPYYYRKMLREQWNLIVERDVNHPSANLYCMSNELHIRRGSFVTDRTTADYEEIAWRCYGETKAVKPTAMVIWTDGGTCATDTSLPADFVNDEAPMDACCDKPLIQHEWRWWSSYPDVRIMNKYTGGLRPYPQEISIEAAKRQGQEHLLPLFAENSQKLQFIEAKAKMEIRRRDFPKMAGISHYSASDITMSPQGIVDDFYDRKYADGATWRETNGDTVIMSSLGFEDRILEAGTEFTCKLSVSDFSHPPMKNPILTWRFMTGEKKETGGCIEYNHIPFQTTFAEEIRIKIPNVQGAVKTRLEAELREGKRVATNSWDLWIFPKKAMPDKVFRYRKGIASQLEKWKNLPVIAPEELEKNEQAVVLSEAIDDSLTKFMRNGGRIVFLAGGECSVEAVRKHRINGCGGTGYFFTPGANYPPFDQGQNGTIIKSHPMLADFPHEGFADWQFYRMTAITPPLDLAELALTDEDPLMRVIHRYPVCHPVGRLLERSLGKGGMILASFDLSPDYIEARYILAGICEYAAGKEFKPTLKFSEASLSRIKSRSKMMHKFKLPEHWRIFAPAPQRNYPFSPEELPSDPHSLEVPDSLRIDGREIPYQDINAASGVIDLAPLIGGPGDGKTAYIYIPFETKSPARIRFGFSPDWWFAAFLDGQSLTDNLKTGGYPTPSADDFTKTADVSEGRHLLAIRFISGSQGSLMHVGAWYSQ